jgi:glycosyltransferase involved in cell wall biosynthesis
MCAAQRSGSIFTGVFVGNAGWLNGRFREAFARAKAAGHDLILRENVTNAELRGLYDAASFTIYCSLDEGFGLPIIESLRHGCPCITSDRGSMREVADQTGGCVIVDPENVAAMAASIAGLVDDAEALARLTREAAQAEWPTWQQYTDELVGFTAQRSLAAGRRHAA